MEKEADSVFEEALRAAQDKTAHKKEEEAKIELFNQNMLASIETYKKDVLPTLKKKVDEFEKDPNINLVLNLVRGFAHKIEQNEKIKGSHLSITHHFSYLSEYLVTYEENPNLILWSTERIEKLTRLVKEGANLAMKTSIYYQAEPEAPEPDRFEFSLRCSNEGVEFKPSWGGSPTLVALTEKEEISRRFGFAFLRKLYWYFEPSHSLEDWGGGAR